MIQLFPNFRALAEAQANGMERNLFLALVFATTNSYGSRLMNAFGEFFTPERVGAVPLSVLITAGEEAMIREQGTAVFLHSYRVMEEFGIPCLEFVTDEESVAFGDAPMLPEGIDEDADVGTVVIYKGELYVVVENNQNYGVHLFYIAPILCVDPTR